MKERFIGFDDLKRAVSMVQVLHRYGLVEQLHRSGDNLSGVCPLHQGHNPSQFRVSVSKNCWFCFGDCHAGGSIIDFVSRKEGIGIREAGILIQSWFNVQPANGSPYLERNGQEVGKSNGKSPVGEVPEMNPPLSRSLENLDQEHPYLTARGLSRAAVETFGLGYCDSGWLAGHVAIPIHNAEGQLVAYAGRWPGPPPGHQPKYKLPRGFRKSWELFNLHRAKAGKSAQPLAVVEGFFGCMLVWQAGYERVVALMGSTLSARQENLLVTAAGPSGRVVLMLDEDEAGRRGRAEAQRRLARCLDVRVIQFAIPGTQPDQLPPERLLELLRKEQTL